MYNFQVPRDLHSTPCVDQDDEIELNYQTEQETRKLSKKGTTASNRKSRKSVDLSRELSAESDNDDSVTPSKRPRKSTASSSQDRSSPNRSRTRESSLTQTPTNRSSRGESPASGVSDNSPSPAPTRGKGKPKKVGTTAGKAGRNSNAVKSTKQKNNTATNQQLKHKINDKVNKVKVAKSMKNRKK